MKMNFHNIMYLEDNDYTIFPDGEYIVRIWPSGKTTMGIIDTTNGLPYYLAAESYPYEGEVIRGEAYGHIENSTYKHRPPTDIELMIFRKYGSLYDHMKEVRIYKRNNKIDSILKNQ